MRHHCGLRVIFAAMLAACSSDTAAGPATSVSWNGLALEAASEISTVPAPPSRTPQPALVPGLRTTVTLRNTTNEAVTVKDGSCMVGIKLYRDATRSGAAAWDQGATENCAAALRYRTFQPGEAATYESVAVLAEIREAGVPVGRHYVTATVRLDVPAVVVSAGEVDIPAS